MAAGSKTEAGTQLVPAMPPQRDAAWLAGELGSCERELAGRSKAGPVEVRVRENRSTLGSLRRTAAGCGWRYTVARRLLEEDPEGALLLGRLLLHRLRRRPVPPAWSRRLAELRRSWSTAAPGEHPPTGARSAKAQRSDPRLAARLAAVARRAAPGLAPEALPAIHWSPSRSRRILGRYLPARHEIRIHAALDHPRVPEIVLDDLLHHELLHALLGPRQQGGRVVFHHSEFRRREQAWPGHAEAAAWCRRHLAAVLAGRR
jgi:hypothetical protein